MSVPYDSGKTTVASDLDQYWMQQAIVLAQKAKENGEVPVGAVIVSGDQLLGKGFNQPIATNDPTAHAEMIAIRDAAQALSNYRLNGSTLYVTLEPCAMCAGALVNARISRLVFGARDLRFGGVRSKFEIADSDILNHKIQVVEGVLAADCLSLIRNFFNERR